MVGDRLFESSAVKYRNCGNSPCLDCGSNPGSPFLNKFLARYRTEFFDLAQSRMPVAGIRGLKTPWAVVLGHLGVDTICVGLCMLRFWWGGYSTLSGDYA